MPIGTNASTDKPSLLDIVATQIQAPAEPQTEPTPADKPKYVGRGGWRGGGRPKNKEQTKPFIIRMPEKLIEEMDAIAKAKGTTKSALIKEILSLYVAGLKQL